MQDVNLIRIFKKKSWVRFVMAQLAILTFIIPCFPMLLPLDLFIVAFFVVLPQLSVIKVYKEYLLCYNPIFFWKPKKLFLYNKIEKVIISHGRTEFSYNTAQIHHINGKVFKYAIQENQTVEFKSALKNQGLKVSFKL